MGKWVVTRSQKSLSLNETDTNTSLSLISVTVKLQLTHYKPTKLRKDLEEGTQSGSILGHIVPLK